MSVVLQPGTDRALIFNRQTGQVLTCSVPTAMENVENGKGVWVHGETGDAWVGEMKAMLAEADATPIVLTEPDVLPLPDADIDPVSERAIAGHLRPISDEHVHVPAATDPLDHDGNGKKGGAKRSNDPERKAIMADLRARGIKFFAGAKTEDLKALLVE